MLSRNASKKPAELWSWVANSSVGLANPENFEGQMRSGIVERMVTENPSEALSKIALNSGEGAVYDLRLGLTIWAKSNPKAANEWYINSKSNLSQIQQDSAAEAFAGLAMKYSELEGAENWANQIIDPEIKNSVIEKINTLR